ncbi:Lipocln_cytosolic_FA-bd_dom domain-containing protein [Meloidogyne graminicola]|uniref:Lipocln_cytosolic_FA-bd_dom domain-containing protein n=1 Tax=Meloidogyne graminicola TaxID=189291 RepID=A0A8S9ZEJ7_9BILA|nr:Lipocln_cytosolic_FA-bd_dom domain-containing protein [Meloidogyne graminicola]
MADKFIGKWKLVDSDNFGDYLKEVGVGFATRTAAQAIKPELKFEIDGDHWKMTSTSTFTTWVCEFDLGKEQEQKTADGRTLMKIKTDDKDSHFEVEKSFFYSKLIYTFKALH